MPTISIRVSEETKSRLDGFAQESGSTLSGVILDAIRSLTGRGRTNYPEDVAPYTLSSTNRLILYNQELLLSMYKDSDECDCEQHAKNAEILASGYTSDYSSVFASLRPEIPYSLCEELYDILDMFRVLRCSYDKLTDKEREEIEERKVSFQGFDYSDGTESPLTSYVEFLFRDGKYQELEEPMRRFSDDGNSHHRNLDMYRRMYRCYSQIWRAHILTGEYLSLEEMNKIVSAIPYDSGY